MKEYEEQAQSLYNKVKKVWPDNCWYTYTHNMILDFIYKYRSLFSSNSSIINAGSGDAVYDLKGTIYNVDLAENLLKNLENAVVASIENIPYEDDKFDSAICVGSVVNYCNVLTALEELSRVLKQKSIMILEYERSQTGELFFTKEYNQNSSLQIYDYNNQYGHKLWLYSDQYIDNILIECGFKIVDCLYFHTFSAVANRFINNEVKAGKFAKMDKILLNTIKRKAAHNRIILCERS